MRVALISDIHGNAVALEAVVRELDRERIDDVICLGDVAQGGPQPAAVVDLLRERGWPCVLGNADEFLLTLDPGSEETDAEGLARLMETGAWSAAQLGDQRLDVVRGFRPTVERDAGGRKLVCCHATPASNEEQVLPDMPREQVERALGDADFVASGHIHVQWLRRVDGRLWSCVGSVGLVYDPTEPTEGQPFMPWAEYAVAGAGSGGDFRVEFRRVRFEVGELMRAIHDSGMPYAERVASQWKDA